ncbi:hypothetical protein OA93_04630 [Flavobacterium sp. KMS]|uniref:PD-(D/E)XK nuclease family protein n=1 Tax=Flavobacterium sp. KMS TaxID=1566023 RepID=UPI00057DEC61|nr:PD-(D/E)XK nuclease family protein [Flavobacterium sp. KMS]KIA99456.1 hypothetical protein OA93_04630 [Flavobacterium sp. KMS]
MLNQLLKLYIRNSYKTPLEDFTTEVFTGLLNLEEEIKISFIEDFLKLPKSDFQLKTQVKYELENDTNCIVDMVLQSETHLCFIENKVNSKEGNRQIERYCKVLDIFNNDGYTTSLFYCTKYFEKKEFSNHSFQQFRWFQIAKFLKKFQSNKLVNEFLNFLKTHNMAQELTFNAKDFMTLDNLQNIINVMNGYLDRVKPTFEHTFKTSSKISDGRTISQILNHNRLIYYYKEIISETGWSELKYGFQLQTPNIYVGIWIDKSNKKFSEFTEYSKLNLGGFNIEIKSNGISIELKKDISIYLNNEEADFEISEWFKNAFEKFADIIKQTPQFNWSINVT